MKYQCINCNHRWKSRGRKRSRQCPHCWGRSSLVSEEEAKIAGSALALLANIWQEQPTFSLKAFMVLVRVMAYAESQEEGKQVAQLLLKASGMDNEKASRLTEVMYA